MPAPYTVLHAGTKAEPEVSILTSWVVAACLATEVTMIKWPHYGGQHQRKNITHSASLNSVVLSNNLHWSCKLTSNSFCSFVSTFQSAQLGPLPTSSSGKMLQEIITSMPNITLIGSKPSNIYVTLEGSGKAAGIECRQWVTLEGSTGKASGIVHW